MRGHSERQIAAELYIAASTVHPHIVHIDDKAGVFTRADAAVVAHMEHGLIHLPPATRPAARRETPLLVSPATRTSCPPMSSAHRHGPDPAIPARG